VKETRECLESALKVSNTLYAERIKIETWLDSTESELDIRESAIPPDDVDAEISFAETSLDEMNKMKDGFGKVKDGYQELMKLCERNSASVQLFRDRWSLFERHWCRLQTRLNTRVASLKVC
jgi:hypothetical protein